MKKTELKRLGISKEDHAILRQYGFCMNLVLYEVVNLALNAFMADRKLKILNGERIIYYASPIGRQVSYRILDADNKRIKSTGALDSMSDNRVLYTALIFFINDARNLLS